MIPLAPSNDLSQKYDRIIYCDLDGVLVDFSKGAERLGVKIDSQDKPHSNEDELWDVINSYGKDKFFAGLPWTKDGQQLWKFINDNFLNVKILTALGRSDKADNLTSRGKQMWLQRNIPSLNISDAIMVPNKHAKKHWAKIGDVLIDDTDICINEWLKKGGIGILHTDTPTTIRQLEKYV